MELGFNDLFKSSEMEIEKIVHVKIENQLGFYAHQIACYHYGSQVMRWN